MDSFRYPNYFYIIYLSPFLCTETITTSKLNVGGFLYNQKSKICWLTIIETSLGSFLQRPRGINITRQPYWKRIHISLVICVSPTYITRNMCTGVHISRGYICYCHNASPLCSSLQSPKRIHISRQPYWKGVHISLVICVSPTHITNDVCTGYTYHGDTYILLWQGQFSRKFAAEGKGDTQNTTAILEAQEYT